MKLPHSLRIGLAVVAASVLTVGPVSASTAAGPRQAAAPGPAAAGPAVVCVAGAQACPIRIIFAAGAYSAQRSAILTGIHAARWFSVRARAGQTLIVVVEGVGPTGGTVYFPNGHHEGQPGGRVFDGTIPVTGTYRIRATESQMGNAWRGKVTVAVMAY